MMPTGSDLSQQPTAPSPESLGRVLVVDDQKNMRATTAMLLRAEGYAVDEAASGDAACESIAHQPYDIVVTDLKMEPMDGLELLRRVRDASPTTQVIVMTAYGTIESAVPLL